MILDTHFLLWAAFAPGRLGPALAAEIAAAERVWFSAVAFWETAIKTARRHPDFDVDPVALRIRALAAGWTELPVDGRHAAAVADLPPIQADPFDRLMVAQARVEGLTLAIRDPVVARYPGPIRLA
jgi:PIN domain nuclease of toxin-antitoxin system